MFPRAMAARILKQVLQGRSLADCLPQASQQLTDVRDQRFLQALCYGVCRWYPRLDSILKQLLEKPFKTKDQDIYCLLLIGLYQLIDMRVPTHAAVTETVSATSAFKKPWAKSLVNAVLRNFMRQREALLEAAEQNVIAKYAHPAWMIQAIQHSWPSAWEDILLANNAHPPFALRVNQRFLSREQYCQKIENFLQAQSATVTLIPEVSSGIVLTPAVDVEQLPGFVAGEVSVQDGAAQLAAELLLLAPQQRVLDACAAPGGKTAHMLELEADIDLLALDDDAERLRLVQDNLARLQLQAQCVCADAAAIAEWWDGRGFDRILLDAPCSASGVVRRHPDIKLLRRAEDIAKLAEQQARLLQALWTVLKPGGLLLYATCSIFQEENAAVATAFLTATPEATEEPIVAAWGTACPVGRQMLPGVQGMDGFYFARFRKG